MKYTSKTWVTHSTMVECILMYEGKHLGSIYLEIDTIDEHNPPVFFVPSESGPKKFKTFAAALKYILARA